MAQPLRRTRSERVVAPRPTVVERALEQRAQRQARVAGIWKMSREERVAAFHAGELNLGQCLAWASRAPDEVPRAPDGEFLFIACRTPEWLGD